MKIVAWIILLLLLGAPLLVAAWWLFPLIAGVCIWALFKYRKAEKVGPFLKPALLGILVIFVVWLGFLPRRHFDAGSYAGSYSARLIRKLGPRSAAPSEELQRIESERHRLLDALARERLKIAEIASALDLYNSADAVFVSRNKNGVSDDAGLGNALASLRNQLAPHKVDDGSTTPDLLDPATLRNLAGRAAAELNQAQKQGLRPGISPDQISEERNQLPRLVSHFQVDALYGQVANLENTLRHALKVNLQPQSSYYFRYDRVADTLTSEQRTPINFSGQQPVSVDVSAMLEEVGEPNFKQRVTVREDSAPERELGPATPQVPLHPETKVLTVTRRVVEPQASHPLIADSSWFLFRGVSLWWPMRLNSSVVLRLRFPEDPTIDWPLNLSIQTSPGDMLSAAYLPRYSFFHDDDALKPAQEPDSNAQEDELVPEPGTPTIVDLAIDSKIKVELLPRYLSHSFMQRYKEYLVRANLLTSLIVMAVSLTFVAIAGSSKS